MTSRTLQTALLCLLAAALSSCGRSTTQGDDHTSSDHESAPAQTGPSNAVDIPSSVRQNLGITFVQAEVRRVEQTLRVPGHFEYLPSARREYRLTLSGRVELLVDQFDAVETGTPLFRIDSPDWRSLKQQLVDAESAVERVEARLQSFGPLREAHRNHEKQLEQTIEIRQERVAQIESVAQAGGGRVAELNTARDAVATAQAELAEILEKEAEIEATEIEAKSERAAAVSKRLYLLHTASTLLRQPVDALTSIVDTEHAPEPRWKTIASVEVLATDNGIVEQVMLTQGAWAEVSQNVVTIVQPDRLRFKASGLQTDLGLLRDGLDATVVPPTSSRNRNVIDMMDSMHGTIMLGPGGNPEERTIDLYVVPDSLSAWARAGMSAQLEIVTDASASPTLAIPAAAVQRDGLVPVFFRRDPQNPDRAVRVEADLGRDDGRWVVVNSGVRAGDEVVLDGAFQLMLATASAGTQQRGGHFHADGTFHEGEDK
ncbi:MAG: hypothetical protein H6815_02105 [Phycisphaeraceae bacterium]|nr:hypothetical protein [Phycisphaerales bacterium]MCB9859221.1 hypothetical protein [Phycisphaeraceae bacterium]